jgi:hypothetical protein
MKRKLTYFLASFVIALTATFAFASVNVSGQASCRTQCRVAYDKCVKQANNPGGLNQCGRAYNNCLARCR